MMDNIFIEGLQGMGKSTLLSEIARRRPEYKVCREGDYSPVELAWCAWMDGEQYTAVLEKYAPIRREIEAGTFREGEHYIVTYTRILTDIPGFHRDLEQYEIYNGRRTLQELERIIFTRYEQFHGSGYLFECAFLQNIVDDLILFHQLSDEEILSFYERLYAVIYREHFRLLYLYSDKIAENIRVIQRERSDDQGNQMWYPMMMEYLVNSPYGKAHEYKDFEDLISHMKHRQQVELRIIREIIGDRAQILPAKEDFALEI
ncbi:MAG: hypothetical protein K2L18_13340 [Acetatifactor sp.]|nr:hypothetical protein [Acetatifactor sp.]